MTLLVVLVLSAVAVGVSPFAVRVLDRKAGWPLAALFIAAAWVVGRHVPDVISHSPLSYKITWLKDAIAPGMDIDFALRGDALSVFFALLALVIGAAVFIYSAAYLHNNDGNTSFYLIMSAFMLSVLLLVLSDDVVVLFIAWELVSIGSFLLIARAGSGGEAGSMRTLILTFTGGLTLLAAVAIMATQAGTTNLTDIIASNFWTEKPGLTTAIAMLIAVSAFTKSAQFPFHFWLPEAMAAATPVSAFLHAAAVVKAGIYLLLRFSPVFHNNAAWNVVLITVGMFTAVMAALFAVQKTDLKRLTAYSTVSHLGWIVATIGVGTPFALAAALVHTFAHALFKSSLFMLIGVVDHQAGSRDVRRLGSLYRQMPFTFISVVVGALSMAAVPPLLGFISKEGMLEAFTEAPLPTAAVWLLLAAAATGALLTITYSTRLVFGAFVDGPRDMSQVKEAPLLLWLPAALPGLMSVPLAFMVGVLDAPVGAAVDTHVHLGLWHGVSTPLLISLGVLAAGAVVVWKRQAVFALADARHFLPFNGNKALQGLLLGMARWGRFVARMADSYSPTPHLTYPILMIVLLAAGTTMFPGVDGVPMQPRVDGIDRPMDLLPLAIVVVSVVTLIITHSRLTAAVMLGTTGVGVTLQILMLGAPDVALTQFLVELLVVVIIMFVLRQQPELFHRTSRPRSARAGIMAIAAGVATFLGVWALLGRHERPEIAMWYLREAPGISGGANVVNTILVEFRALDTMGELSVLGMAGVVIAAVVGSIPRHPFLKGTHPAPFTLPEVNSIPMRMLCRALVPVLSVLAFVIFMRGHNDPGGGFIAALVACAAVVARYLSKGSDGPIVKQNTPFYLTGFGMLTALFAGVLGLTHGSFLYPIHGHILHQHVTTSMIFDLGVFLAVLGMLTLAINALGGPQRPGADRDLLPFTRGSNHPLPQTPQVDASDTSEAGVSS